MKVIVDNSLVLSSLLILHIKVLFMCPMSTFKLDRSINMKCKYCFSRVEGHPTVMDVEEFISTLDP